MNQENNEQNNNWTWDQETLIKILTYFCVFLTMSYILMLCFNASISDIFSLRKITFFESVCINFICRILFQTVEFEK